MTPQVRRYIGLAALAATVAAVSSILLLAISGWFLTAAALAGAAGAATAYGFNYLIPSAMIRLLAILRTVSRYGERLWSHQAALFAMAGLRGRLFARLVAQDNRNAPDLSGGDASARLIGDIAALEDLIVRRPTLPASMIGAATGVIIAAFAGWQAAVVLLALLVMLPTILRKLGTRLTRTPARDAAEALGKLRDRYVEYAAARAEIIAYGLADRVTLELNGIAAELDRANAQLFRGEGVIAAVLTIYTGGTAALVLMSATASAPRVALALLASVSAIEAMTAWARTALRQARVEEGLRRLASLERLPAAPFAPSTRGSQALALTIGDESVAPGTRIAITGQSGSGKTLLLESLAGWRTSVFELSLGDRRVTDIPSATIRDQIALSPQDAPMIAGSIADNLRVARSGVDANAMWQALRIACLDQRILTAPEGLDTMLGEGGGILSGGELKRLSLARALLAERPWLLLDEPTEGLDSKTEALLIERLRAWLEESGTGLVLVSHRQAPLTLSERMLAIGVVPRRQLVFPANAMRPPAQQDGESE
ncbi:ATP-binding cassette domain-containing protein [Porphyrobacter algicida]|uniref:ATP-binding cassette domain-containing protein n=2 Tax=Qipengyuania algicida TaxID=1836209 RepID=A0A845AKP8_9SPHN|nr:ATP-binding cassette domain-containing protein [Qipengyuania algicida]